MLLSKQYNRHVHCTCLSCSQGSHTIATALYIATGLYCDKSGLVTLSQYHVQNALYCDSTI